MILRDVERFAARLARIGADASAHEPEKPVRDDEPETSEPVTVDAQPAEQPLNVGYGCPIFGPKPLAPAAPIHLEDGCPTPEPRPLTPTAPVAPAQPAAPADPAVCPESGRDGIARD